MREATLIRLPCGYGLQLDDRSPDAKPDKLPVAIAAFDHFIASPGCDDLGIGPVLADQQITGSPDVAIGDHSGCRSKSILLPVTVETSQVARVRPRGVRPLDPRPNPNCFANMDRCSE